ncbi:zinc-binding dehydrogenase [Streptosporangium vulgare]|uniref:zinc-binding dehydrogenase n=1 Tax=Streptosporangium vulgare TaxID=46190 RepID=UPI0031DB0C66
MARRSGRAASRAGHALHVLPDTVGRGGRGDGRAGAGNALRAVEAANLSPGDGLLGWGPGTIGLLAARFALAHGAEVHVMGLSEPSLEFARGLGAHGAWTSDKRSRISRSTPSSTPPTPPALPSLAVDLVEPGKRVVYIGLAPTPSAVDTRMLVLKDVTAVGILSASPGPGGGDRALRLRRGGPPAAGGGRRRARRGGRDPLRLPPPRGPDPAPRSTSIPGPDRVPRPASGAVRRGRRGSASRRTLRYSR